MTAQLTPAQFVAKWSRTELPERAASQEHFIDLCRLLGQPTPAEHDATGAEYTFEKGVVPTGAASKGAKGDFGFADVWWRGKFALEYKRKGKYRDLTAAYRQLCQYREALDNPPLLIVSDIARTEIHTNFTGTAKRIHVVTLEDLAEPESIDLLRRVFTDPASFKPTVTPERITEEIAQRFGKLARSLRDRGHDAQTASHFLMKCMFCLFAEDVDLLPTDLFKTALTRWQSEPKKLTGVLTGLFDAMRTGGAFGAEPIDWFNGGLFDESSALELNGDDIGTLILAAKQDWASVEPAIFGTLFERSLDPNTRAQIGAHYTSREDIMLVIEPVIMAPLRREWEQAKAEVEKQLERRRRVTTKETQAKADKAIEKTLREFVRRLASLRVLDPACGSGNFLYVAIQQLLDLEKEVVTFAASPEIALGLIPQVRPTQLHGIEINPYAAELAQVVIWIGYLQWMRDNGFIAPRDPILESIQTIECRDAILEFQPALQPAHSAGIPPGVNAGARAGVAEPEPPQSPSEPPQSPPEPPHSCGADSANRQPHDIRAVPAQWPAADFIIGNPPFLGSKVFRQQGLDDDYISAMYATFDLPNTSDLCCYWFELARQTIETNNHVRVGLLATQGIRGGANRTVLGLIKKTGDIFMAWSDRKWILDGAAVHVSIVGFDAGREDVGLLDGQSVASINANLTSEADTTAARLLRENDSIGWSIGTQKGGPFEFDYSQARALLDNPNPSGKSNLDVVRPWRNASDVAGRLRGHWIVDFGPNIALDDAAEYEQPFEYIRQHVKPMRDQNRRDSYRLKWWIHQEPRGELRSVLDSPLVLLTPRVSKHRLWIKTDSVILPDCALVVFARSDDYFFGILHSSIHELWTRRMGTQLREAESGFRYTPTTCFETFPLPWPPGASRWGGRGVLRPAGMPSGQRSRSRRAGTALICTAASARRPSGSTRSASGG